MRSKGNFYFETAEVRHAGYLSKQLDAMLYVVRHDYTDKHLVEEGLHSLNQDCADGVGYVLNPTMKI